MGQVHIQPVDAIKKNETAPRREKAFKEGE
jgi:hypothetical protein